MAVIDSPTTSNAATINGAVKAINATEYFKNGVEVTTALASAIYAITATTNYTSIVAFSSTAYIFHVAVQSTATRSVYIRKINITTNFTGTGAASSAQFALHLWYGGSPGANGTAMKYKTSYPSPQAIFWDNAVLGSTTITAERQLVLANIQNPRRIGSSMLLNINFMNTYTPRGLYLNPYMTMGATKFAGIGVQLLNSSVVGDFINIQAEWGEYA